MANKEDVYGAFVDFYGDIKLVFIKNLEQNWVLYGTEIYSGLNQHRYIFVIVPARLAREQETTLNQLDWVSFQTRTTDDVYKLPTAQLFISETQKQALSDVIVAVNRTKEETQYITNNLPIKIRLLHDPKKNNYLQFPDKTLLYQALATFRCVIDLL
jgi:hypothetical protein